MQERIETRRLTLRRFAAGDWPDLYEYLSQPETVRYEPYDPFDETQARAEAARRAGDEAFWAVCLRETGKVIGKAPVSPFKVAAIVVAVLAAVALIIYFVNK